MHPPWITLHFFFLFLAVANGASGNIKLLSQKNDSPDISVAEKEVIERERRLIPYMTYYVVQNLANANSARQNAFLPTSSSRHRLPHFDAIPRTPPNNQESVKSPLFEEFSRPVVRVQNPVYLTSAPIQVQQDKYQKPNRVEIPAIGHVFRLQPDILRPRPYPQPLSQQIQIPNQIHEVKAVPVEQKLVGPHFIKVIPLITRLAPREQNPIILSSTQPSYSPVSKFPLQPPAYFTIKDQSVSISPDFQNVKKGNEVYTPDIYQQTPIKVTTTHSNLIPDRNNFIITKANLPNVAPPVSQAPPINFDFTNSEGVKSGNNLDLNEGNRVNLTISGYAPNLIANVVNLTTVNPDRPIVYYTQKVEDVQRGPIYTSKPRDFLHAQNAAPLPRLQVPQEEDVKFVAAVTPISITNDLGYTSSTVKYNGSPEQLHVYKQPTLDNLLSIIRESNNLPQNLTPNNIDNSIKTLAFILERLNREKSKSTGKTSVPPKTEQIQVANKQTFQNPKKVHRFPQPSGTSTPGRPGIDYPTYSSIPPTNFNCSTQRYKGFFGDPDTKCQVWHYCDLNGGQASFLCPNGTIFSQVALTCDWWFNVKCASTSQLYVLNERLYKYILPFSPSFPEDYSGPIVDTYLAAKFKEMESKSKSKALKSPSTTTDSEVKTETSTEALKESNDEEQ